MRLSKVWIPTVLVALGAAALTAATAPRTTTPLGELDGSYRIDGGHSSLLFRITHLGVSEFYGQFEKMGGAIQLDDDAAKCSIEIEIETASVTSRAQGRDEHIKSPDFLNAREFPKATFKSTSVKRRGDELTVTGDLTLHGVTKEVTAKMKMGGPRDTGERFGVRAGFHGELTFKRSDFEIGANFPATMLSDEVTLIMGIEALKG